MNPVQLILLGSAAVAAVLYCVRRRWAGLARRDGRFMALVLLAAAFLAPFAWITCAAFKDRRALMEYTFLPPVSAWREMLNLGNFRKLFEPRTSLQGTIVFWQYILNSLFLSSAAT